jgi:WD40 repeat protein
MAISAHLSCTRCGTDNPERASFCLACGNPLRADAAPINSRSLTGLLAPDHILNQRYRVISQVGKGGFGAVYKAGDILFADRFVAVKEMGQSWLTPDEAVIATEAFKREAQLLANLSHPGLPHIYDQFFEGSHWYLVMDYIEGETLDEHLRDSPMKRLPAGEALEIGIKVCTVLDYLHTREPPIIFRDLKPANIMLTPDGRVVLIDFGIARHFKPGQIRDTIAFGSPGYAPPEQYGKGQTTPRADIFSLGATLHQALSGCDPADSPFRFRPLHLPEYLAPPGLDIFIMHMLELDEENRPISMAAVKQTLQSFAAQWTTRQADSVQPRVLFPQQRSKSGLSLPSGKSWFRSGQPRQRGTLAPTRANVSEPSSTTATSIFRGHTGRVMAAAWSWDSKLIASGGGDCTVQVWDTKTSNTLFVYLGHEQWVKTVAWSPDGTRIASSGADTTVQVWDALTGAVPLTYRGHTNIVSMLAWSPDGKYIASVGYDKTLQVWDAHSGEQLGYVHQHTGIVNALAWSPNGSHIATASDDGTVQIWTVARNGHIEAETPTFIYRGHKDKVSAVAWSPNGVRIASGGWDNTVQVWDALTGDFAFTHRDHTSWINAVTWSPNSQRVASASNDASVQVWEASTGREFFTKRNFFTYNGHHEWIRDVAWSPDGTRIASCGHDQTVQVWQAR